MDHSIQRALNEVKKRELEEKYGARFSEESSLPPEIEAQWLSNIEEFELRFDNCRRVKVREFLKFPELRPIGDIEPEQLHSELERAVDLLADHNIVVDCLGEVSDQDLYQFLTTELMEEEIDDLKLDGYISHYIYEEFHPNDAYDAKEQALHFLWTLFDRDIDFLATDLSRESTQRSDGTSTTPEDIIDRLRLFVDQFKSMNHTANVLDCRIDGGQAIVRLNVGWDARMKGSRETVRFDGEARIRMEKSPYGGFDIVQFSVPGVDV